jgi:aubergine-like protein
VVEYEFPQIISHIGKFDRAWKPKFTIIVVNKRINTKFFDGTANPESGTLVNQDVVGRHYNFYLLSHSAGRGTATPTHYNVVYDSSDLPSNVVENLTYRLCFNYYNWSGAIKAPAPCQYAHKLAHFVGKSTKTEFSDRIREGYFFL